jgi:hypothetical protein
LATTDHLSSVQVLIVDNSILERLQKVFLKAEMRQLLLLQEIHGELSERIERKEADIGVVVAADLGVSSL